MRNTLIYISILLLALSQLGATDLIRPRMNLTSTPTGVHVNLDFQHVTESQWRTMLESPDAFHQFGYGVAGGPGDAALPMITELIPIAGDGVPVIRQLDRMEYRLNSLALKATPAGHLDSDQQTIEIAAYDWDRSTRSFPTDILPGEPVRIKGQLYLPLTIHPVSLDQTSRTPQIPTSIQFDIEGIELAEGLEDSNDGGIRSVITPGDQFAPRGRYLIITPPQFETYISYFADWKRRMGYQVNVVSTSVAGASASTLKAYIQNLWDAGIDRPDFLVLVGDEDQGIGGHYIQNPQGENLVTDHPYALLEGDDSFPELMVGRLSVDSVSELVAFTGKIVAYESNPFTENSDWFQRALMISTTWGAASAEDTKEWVADKLIENGFSQVYTAYHPNVSTTSAISTPINSGVGFVNYRGFGMYNGWFGPDFTNTDIYNLIRNGAMTPVITSVVCGGGNFAATTEDPCFGEAWTRIGTFSVPKGAVAFFGPSELYTHTQFNNVIDIGIYSGIFDQGITTLGEALWNGKFELWRNYYQNTFFPFDQTPEFYHHIYNLLGDPGMQLWTTAPQAISVNHLEVLTTADNAITIDVSNDMDQNVAGAYVSLLNGENAVGGYTNSQGEITLPFMPGAETEIDLTITGKNLHPYLATIPVSGAEFQVSLASWTIATGDQLTPGQSSTMSISLENSGDAINGLEIDVHTNTPGISLSTTPTTLNIPANATYQFDPVTIQATDQVAHGLQIEIVVVVSSGPSSISWSKFMTVQAPVVSINNLSLVSGNLDSGDTALVSLEMLNSGGLASGPMTITALPHDLVDISQAPMACPSIDVDGTGMVTGSFDMVFSDQVFPGERLILQFECSQENRVQILEYEIEVGLLSRYGPSRSDDYGYRMFDNWDLAYSKAPAYDWIEIDPNQGGLFGTTINVTDLYEEGDASRSLTLPFPVTYYGETYHTITVCSNGWAAFGNQTVVDFHNRTIPSPIGPTAMLAPFWDDLVTSPGVVLRKNLNAGEAYIIEWSRMENLNNNNELSFQIIIYDTEEYPTISGDNDIKFQYQTYENIDVEGNFSTVGIESPEYDTGLLASYNGIDDYSIGNIRSGSAILFTTDRGERLPDALASVSNTQMNFSQNPWTSAQDSIIITNVGESPLAYNININSDFNRLPPGPPMPHENVTKTTPSIVENPASTREGSDAYGYFWRDSNDPSGPVYNWIDIETQENRVYLQGDLDDSSVGPLALGFAFPFYDGVFSHMFASSNGTISFFGNYAPWLNTFLPSTSAPSALIAPWWDDLNNDVNPQGSLYFWSNGYDQCILTWKDFPQWGTSDVYSFQVIFNSFGKMLFQYQTVDGAINSSTIGIQSAERNAGLLIRYNEETPFEAETAISIQPPVPWFMASGWSGQINPGESSAFVMDIQSLNLDPGHYQKNLTLFTSAANHRETPIIVGLDVIHGQPPLGDVTFDYVLNIQDLMKMLDFILLIEEMNEDQFDVADISIDNAVNIIDVVMLIEEILETQ